MTESDAALAAKLKDSIIGSPKRPMGEPPSYLVEFDKFDEVIAALESRPSVLEALEAEVEKMKAPVIMSGYEKIAFEHCKTTVLALIKNAQRTEGSE